MADVSLRCQGFNAKNRYDRQTPWDQDYLRKMARATQAALLEKWFNRDVVSIFKQHHAFDAEGIFIGDATYLFVPDNPNYEGSVRLLLDEHNHPVESTPLSPQKLARCRWRRCYKLVSLIHTNRAGEFFLYAGLKLASGNSHECPLLYELVEQFVGSQGKGVIKRLIVDRGFLDGPALGRCKRDWHMDVLIPIRRRMDLSADGVGLAERGELEFQPWTQPAPPPRPIPLHRPVEICQREQARQRTLAKRKAQAESMAAPRPPSKQLLAEEVAVVRGMESWQSTAIVNRERYADGHCEYWVLLDTAPRTSPAQGRCDYRLRTSIEERHRQLKCFSALEAFSSTAFNLIVNQVVFVWLTYSLLQWYVLRLGRRELNPTTRPRTLDLLRPTHTIILIYPQNYFACLSPLQHQQLVLTLSAPARKKILAKTRKLRRALAHQLDNARPP